MRCTGTLPSGERVNLIVLLLGAVTQLIQQLRVILEPRWKKESSGLASSFMQVSMRQPQKLKMVPFSVVVWCFDTCKEFGVGGSAIHELQVDRGESCE